MKDIFTDANLMLALVGGTVAVAITQVAGIKQATARPLLTLAGGALLLPVAHTIIHKNKYADAA